MKAAHDLDDPLVLTVSEVASILTLDRAKVYVFIQEKLIDAFKLGSEWRIKTTSVRELLPQLGRPQN